MLEVKCRDEESLMVTHELDPLNTRALPYFPALVQVVFLRVPVFRFPDRSVTVVPVPSSKLYAATRPEPVVAKVVAVAVLE
jgi:hypothetical protein